MKIWITAPFQELYLEKLKKDNEVCYENWFDTGIIREGKELAKLLNEKGTEIFVTEEDVVQKEVFEQCPTLKMLVVCRAGTSNIDLDAAKRNNVIVVNTPGRNAVGVAEMVVGMMISVSRNFYKGEAGPRIIISNPSERSLTAAQSALWASETLPRKQQNAFRHSI